MIILFHCLSLIVFQLLRHRKRIKFLESMQKIRENPIPQDMVTDLEHKLKFDPPVFRQRYAKVYEILLDERWRKKVKKLCDFGCAEFGLFVFIKRLSSLNEILCIDIEEYTLRDYVRRIYPLTLEYLKRRESPLQISVFAGSVADPDYRLQCTDAVVAVELVEHLYPDVLDAFPYNIFGFIEPKIVIITTPNSDFNVLFSSDPKRMRHYDHKFEWSRAQFEEWATNIVTRFPDYTVSFSGIGAGPAGTEHLGECSQMAVFIRKDLLDDSFVSKSYSSPCRCDSVSLCKDPTETAKMSCSCTCMLCCPNSSYGVCTYYSFSKQISSFEIEDNEEANPSYGVHYKFIEKVEYPFFCDNRTEEQKMMDEFRYRINNFGQAYGRFFVEERNRSEIPLTDLIYGPDSFFITESELSKLLTKHDYKIEECIIQETGQLENCVVYEPVMERYSCSSEASGYDSDYPIFEPNGGSLSDWDDWDEPYVKEESDQKYDSSTDLTSEEVTPPDNETGLPSDVDGQDKPSGPLVNSRYKKSFVKLPKSFSEEQSNLFEESTSDLTTRNKKIRFNKLVDEKAYLSLSSDSDESNEASSCPIPPARTFINNFLNPRAERVQTPNARERELLPGPSNVGRETKKTILKVSSTGIVENIGINIVHDVFSKLKNEDESEWDGILDVYCDSESTIVQKPVIAEDNFLPAIDSNREIEELSSSEIPQPENQSKSGSEIDGKDMLMHSEHQEPSPPDIFPQFSPENSEETDFFDETSTTPKLSSEDNKIHLKKLVGLEKAFFMPVSTSSHQRIKIDPNRVNELDKFGNVCPGRAFFNRFLTPQPHIIRKSLMKDRDRDCSPGPSNVMPKKRKRSKKGGSLTDVDSESPMDDIKSITNCIVENSLNKLDITEVENITDDVIEFNIEPELALVPVDEMQEPASTLENDPHSNKEGIFYNAVENIGYDVENANSEMNEETFLLQPVENNNAFIEDIEVVQDPPIFFMEQANEENAGTSLQQLENQVARASREALFDPNSVQDLLEDFEIPPPIQEAVDILNLGNNVVLLGIRSVANGIDRQVISVENGFPNWLLQILGTQVVQEGSVTSTSSEEPHYYCQGDGLGVHPSVMAVEVEDEEDEETTSSSNNTADFAEVDQGVSSQDMSSLPEDSQANTENQELPEETDDTLRNETTEQTEYFDTVSVSSDTGIDTSKST